MQDPPKAFLPLSNLPFQSSPACPVYSCPRKLPLKSSRTRSEQDWLPGPGWGWQHSGPGAWELSEDNSRKGVPGDLQEVSQPAWLERDTPLLLPGER